MTDYDELRRAAKDLTHAINPTTPPPPGSMPPSLPAAADDRVAATQRQLIGVDWLARVYPTLSATGICDATTRAALTEFQRVAGLAVTGVIDTATQAALDATQHVPSITPALPAAGAKREFSGATKAVATLVGMALTVLTMIDGVGVIPPDARDIVAIIIATATPIVVYFVPDYQRRPPAGT